ncbi:porin [Thermosulfidibacter takaii ABI70S6]|uniref:Porin n=1 Tax=Thermosulfidibacter takaii (strain DSM 17441 / JCM 13301 / NBRC 103674 / ABI70S6) TaxID=1298851 RepID=A0A0S3QRS6_THET7|nr:carbohydrate porin [Thermosulfidibacter takaii]BAT71042.1 porin [Thermosulfidibacter takaii ABI70S6]
MIRRTFAVFMALVFATLLFSGLGVCSEIDSAQLKQILRTLNQLKAKVRELERKVQRYEKQQKELEAERKELEETKEAISSLKEALGNIKVSADITMVGQGTMNNGNNNKEHDEGDVQDGAWSFDLEVESKLWRGSKAYMLIEGGQGEGVEDEVPTLSGFNDDAPGSEDAHMEVTEAWWEQEFSTKVGKFTFTLGKVDLTNYFDTNEVANDETTQFLSSGFVNNLAVEWPDDNGFGARLTFEPTEDLYISLGWAEADADWEDIFEDGFGIVEVGYHARIFGLDGNYRVYAWVNTKDHLDVDDLKDLAKGKISASKVDDDNTNWGVGVSLDQKVAEGITFFARAGIMDSDVVAGSIDGDDVEVETVPIKGAYSFGFRVSGMYWNRENDEFAVAFGSVIVDDDAERFYRRSNYYDYYRHPEDIDMADEYHLEAYYKVSFFDGKLEFTPDFQVVWNPNGIDEADTVYVVGTRMQVNF